MLRICVVLMCVALQVQATPVMKVIKLLENLKKSVVKDGAEEAKTYDEFACFCKEQADNKLYAITKSEEKIAMMEAKIKKLDGEIEELDAAVKEDKEKKSELEGEGKKQAATRKEAFEKYEEKEEDLSSAVKAIKEAIEAIKASKDKMKDAKTLLLHSESKTQNNATVVHVSAQKVVQQKLAHLAKSKHAGPVIKAIKAVAALLEAAPGQPHAYEFASNDIIATLQGLLKIFVTDKNDLDSEETQEKNGYEMEKGARDFKIKTLGELIDSNTEMSAKKNKEKSNLEMDLDDESKAKKDDKGFMDDLTDSCEEKAEGWDKRSKARSGEVTALTKAIDELRSGAAPNYKLLQDRKLALTAKRSVVLGENATDDDADGSEIAGVDNQDDDADSDEDEEDDEDQDEDSADEGASFLQTWSFKSLLKQRLRGMRRGRAMQPAQPHPRRAIVDFLAQKAAMIKSTYIAMLVAKIKLGKGNMDKIVDLIKGLIDKIKDQMEADAEQKDWCADEMKKAMESRDDQAGDIEDHSASIDGSKAQIVNLDGDITHASQQVAELYKSLNEITELRTEEKEENEITIRDAEAGKLAVENAIEILKGFYGFIQVQAVAKVAGPDRDGKSVEDMAPEVETGEYKGNQDAAKGIFGMLEVILSDFDATLKSTKKAEEEGESAFDKESGEIKDSIDENKKTKKDKKSEMETEEADLVDHKESLKDAKTGYADAKDELNKLRPQCVDIGLTWEQKKARMEEEIKALKEALTILEDWGKEK